MSELIVSPGPHIKNKADSVGFEMRDVNLALIPALGMGLYYFGVNALVVILSGIISAMIFEVMMVRIRKRKLQRQDLGSAGLTGLLLAFCVSSATPWWAMAAGTFVAIVIAKHAFGGLGFNIFNPALVGRAFMLASWPVLMTTWLKPFDAVTTATPLGLLKEKAIPTDHLTMLLGNHAGSIGEVCAIALLIGALYLIWRRTIDVRISFSYVATVAVMALIFRQDVTFHLLAGGLILGAFYMATDPVTSPVTKPGRFVFGFGCGFITMVIRLYGGYPEGVCYSILIMNAVTPLLDRYLQGRIFGRKKWTTV